MVDGSVRATFRNRRFVWKYTPVQAQQGLSVTTSTTDTLDPSPPPLNPCKQGTHHVLFPHHFSQNHLHPPPGILYRGRDELQRVLYRGRDELQPPAHRQHQDSFAPAPPTSLPSPPLAGVATHPTRVRNQPAWQTSGEYDMSYMHLE